MGKGQVSDQDLSTSLQALGGFGNLRQSGARRDSPFGSEFVKQSVNVENASAVLETNTVSRPNEQVVEVSLGKADESNADPAGLSSDVPSALVRVPRPKRLIRKPLKQSHSTPEFMSNAKSLYFTERVTAVISPEMRTEVNALANNLQRRRMNKDERITANTVFRVAIQLLLSGFELEAEDVVNNEDEFLALAKRKVLRQ